MNGKTFCISINGQRAVDLGYAIQNGYCYSAIYDSSTKIGQLEVVIDEPGIYKGRTNKWVDVSYIEQDNVDVALSILSRMGFKGCHALIIEEIDDGKYFEQNTLCGVII